MRRRSEENDGIREVRDRERGGSADYEFFSGVSPIYIERES
jgi:hypothetical protein